MFVLWMAVAHAERCVAAPVEELTFEPGAISALAVKEMTGALSIVPSADEKIRVSGRACGEIDLKFTQREGVIELSSRGKRSEERKVTLTLAVPASISALGVYELVGALDARDLPLQLAVVSGVGPVEVSGVQQLRVAHLVGPLTAIVRGDVAVDQVVGPVSVRSLEGKVSMEGVLGQISSDAYPAD